MPVILQRFKLLLLPVSLSGAGQFRAECRLLHLIQQLLIFSIQRDSGQ
ncbi:Uncharacterised protein [Salmonella enterica subsp. enterica]|nr:Uncharacterised protein [Salmonella enterica subsp. enterica]